MCILPLSKRLGESKGQIFDAEMDAVVQQLVAKVIPVPGGKLGAIADLQFTRDDESGDNILHFAALVCMRSSSLRMIQFAGLAQGERRVFLGVIVQGKPGI